MLAPIPVRQLVPVPAGDHLRRLIPLMMFAATELYAVVRGVILPATVPYQETLRYRSPCDQLLPLLLKIKAIHPRGEVALPPVIIHHGCRLRWIQQNMGVGPLKFRQLRHTDRHFRQARAALAEQAIRGQPGAVCILLHILAQPHVDGIMVLRHIPGDVVQTAVAYLNIYLGAEYQREELDECRYDSRPSAPLEMLQQPKAYNPRADVPVRGATALVLGLHTPLVNDEVPGHCYLFWHTVMDAVIYFDTLLFMFDTLL